MTLRDFHAVFSHEEVIIQKLLQEICEDRAISFSECQTEKCDGQSVRGKVTTRPPHSKETANLLSEDLLGAVFDLLGNLLSRRGASIQLGNGIIDDATHRRWHILIVVELEVFRSCETLLNSDHVGIGQTNFTTLDDRDTTTAGGNPLLLFSSGQVFDEVNGFRRGILADGKAIAAAHSIRQGTSATLDRREGEHAQIGNTLLISALAFR